MIDLYFAHGEDRSTPIEETVDAMGALVTDGIVARWGISNHPTWLVERARGHALAAGSGRRTTRCSSRRRTSTQAGRRRRGQGPPVRLGQDETRDYVAINGLELWAYSPLIQGSFDREDRPFPQAYDHPGTTARLATLEGRRDERHVAPSQVVLAWLLAQGIRPIVGVSSLEQLDSALAAGALDLDAETMARLDQPT